MALPPGPVRDHVCDLLAAVDNPVPTEHAILPEEVAVDLSLKLQNVWGNEIFEKEKKLATARLEHKAKEAERGAALSDFLKILGDVAGVGNTLKEEVDNKQCDATPVDQDNARKRKRELYDDIDKKMEELESLRKKFKEEIVEEPQSTMTATPTDAEVDVPSSPVFPPSCTVRAESPTQETFTEQFDDLPEFPSSQPSAIEDARTQINPLDPSSQDGSTSFKTHDSFTSVTVNKNVHCSTRETSKRPRLTSKPTISAKVLASYLITSPNTSMKKERTSRPSSAMAEAKSALDDMVDHDTDDVLNDDLPPLASVLTGRLPPKTPSFCSLRRKRLNDCF